jgi:endo-1,4-beta-xylanase
MGGNANTTDILASGGRIAASGGGAEGGSTTGGRRSGIGGTNAKATGGTQGTDIGTAGKAGGESVGGRPTTGGSGSPGGAAPVLKKFVGNISSSQGRTDVGSLKFKDYWNQVSPQNEGKWGEVTRSKGKYDWTSLDTLHTYAKSNNIIFKEHTFIWGAQQPTGFTIGEDDVKDWMKQFCIRYPDVAVIDVVNEPPPHTNPSYANAIGGGTNGDWAWISNAFKWAREACPNAVLVLNDYNNIEWDKDSAHFIDIVKAIKKSGAPIDAIGCQAHDLDHMNGSGALDVDLAGVTKRLNALIAEVPDIYITELDLSTKDDALQLKLYQTYWPLFWDSPNVKGITIWGWVVGMTWSMAPDSGLITQSGTKRPAFNWLLQQMGKG